MVLCWRLERYYIKMIGLCVGLAKMLDIVIKVVQQT